MKTLHVLKNTRLSKFYLRGKPIQNTDLLDGVKTAIKTNNIGILKILLTYKIDFSRDPKILEPVIINEDVEMVELFLKNGFNVKDNTEIIDIALGTKNVEIIRLLLYHDAKVERDSPHLKNVALDYVKILQLLLFYCSYIGESAELLQTAIENNKFEAVRLLLKDTVSLNDNEYNYALGACKSNNIKILKLLFEKGTVIKSGYNSGVIQACRKNNLEMLKLLLKKDPNLVLNQNYGLKEAYGHYNVQMIKLLIKHGVDTSEFIEFIAELVDNPNDKNLIDYFRTQVSKLKQGKWPFDMKIFGWGFD